MNGVAPAARAVLMALLACVLLHAQAANHGVSLTDITAQAGISARHDNGAAGQKLLPETMGAGAAFLDFDNDGDQDLVMTVNNGPARVLRNDTKAGQSVRLSLTGTKSNRSAIGTVVYLTAAGRTRMAMVRTGSSYLSQSELPLTFGLGSTTRVEKIEVRWPSGHVDRIGPENAGQTLEIREGTGVTRRVPFTR